MSGPNFNYPETWEQLRTDGPHYFRLHPGFRAQSWLTVCPECSAVVVDAAAHRDWHKELEAA